MDDLRLKQVPAARPGMLIRRPVAEVFEAFVDPAITGALSLGFWMWLGFPVAMLVGASLWDNKPWMLVLIHGGDWLVKMLIMAVIVGVWRR